MAKKKSLFISILRIITMLMLVLFVAVVIICLVEGDTSIIPSGIIMVLLCFFSMVVSWKVADKESKFFKSRN